MRIKTGRCDGTEFRRMLWIVGRDWLACQSAEAGEPKIRDAGGEGDPCHADGGALHRR